MTTAPAGEVASAVSVPGTVSAGAVASTTHLTVTLSPAPSASTDELDPQVTVTCSTASGSTFAVGTTAVTCSATDDAGNVTTRTFDVVVRGALEQIVSLRSDITDEGLPRGTEQSLVAKLDAATRDLQTGGNPCDDLASFVSTVNGLAGRRITNEQAQRWKTAANQIAAVAGC